MIIFIQILQETQGGIKGIKDSLHHLTISSLETIH